MSLLRAAALSKVWEYAPEPKRVVWIEGADHFFQGIPASPGAKLNRMQAEIRSWLHDTFGLDTAARHP